MNPIHSFSSSHTSIVFIEDKSNFKPKIEKEKD